MKRKLYGSGISPMCEYCMIGDLSEDRSIVFCPKKGIVSRDFSCKKFKYDPLSRIPRVSPKLGDYSKEDFEL